MCKTNRSGKSAVLNKRQLEMVFASLPEKYSLLAEILYFSAGRVSEVTNLKVNNINFTDGLVTFEKSSMAREGHLWRRSLRGTPEEIGAASGALSGRLYAKIDERLGAMVRQRYGQGIEAWAEHMLLRWDYRATTNALRLDDQRELSAMIEALPPVRQGGLSVYERLHLMQCMVDVTQRLDDFLIEGVTFAAVPSKTSASSDRGNVLVGRSLSVDLGDDFDADRIVSFYYPDGKYPFVSVGWAGLVGVVTGVNARGVVVRSCPCMRGTLRTGPFSFDTFTASGGGAAARSARSPRSSPR